MTDSASKKVIDDTDHIGTCHRCECLRKRHYYRKDPQTGHSDLIRCLDCDDCPEFVHHPGWEPLTSGVRVRLPDGQMATIKSYDPTQDCYWIDLNGFTFYKATHHLAVI